MTNSAQLISTPVFLINLLISILAFYSAWVNLLQKQITAFGPDALIVFIAHLITKKRVEKLRKHQGLSKRMGVVMLLLGYSTLKIVIIYFAQK